MEEEIHRSVAEHSDLPAEKPELSAEQQEFNRLAKDEKLSRLNQLLAKSKVFSEIISNTLFQSSVEKKEAKVKDEEPVKKKRRGDKKKSKPKQELVYELNEETAERKKNLENTPKTRHVQPELLSGVTLRDYQLEGMDWLITLFENGLNGILADEMGLGKTLQSIALLAFLYEQGIRGPFLITCPLSTVHNWVAEFERFAPNLPVLGYVGAKDEREMLRNNYLYKSPTIVVTSYEISIRDRSALGKIQWKFLIVDEGHRLKNNNCLLIKELKRLPTSNRLLLTGTPLQNNLDELWSLLNFILPDIFHDIELFQQWFDFEAVKSLKDDQDSEVNQIINAQVQKSILSNLHTILKPFLLRRLKKDVVKGLVPKKEFLIHAKMTPPQEKLYKAALDRNLMGYLHTEAFKDSVKKNTDTPHSQVEAFIKQVNTVDLEDDSESKVDDDLQQRWDQMKQSLSHKKMQNLMMQLRLICNSPYLFYLPWDDPEDIDLSIVSNSCKLQILSQLVPRLTSKNHKILIFSQFTKMLDLIHDWCELEDYTVCRIDGSTSLEERKEEIENFHKSKKHQIFLLSTRAGGLGINLAAADSVILFDSDWNPQVDLQAMDRAHRIGQKNPVNVYRLVTMNTIEQVMLAKADSKRVLEKLVISLGKFETLGKLAKADSLGPAEQLHQKKLAQELDRLFSGESKFKNPHQLVDNKLSEEEMEILLDRGKLKPADEQLKRVQLFETVTAFDD